MATKILIIDDDETVHRSVAEHLADEETRLLHATDPVQGMQLARCERPDLVLLDMNLPRMDGLKVCHHLKDGEETRDIPILFFTVASNAQDAARALEIGASDYIRKPVEPLELRARVQANLRTKRMVDLLRVQARIDALTGLRNRTAFDDALASALSAWDRAGAPMSLLMIDVDHFKRVNDTRGHGVGDEVLRRLGRLIGSTCRPHDAACRFGGDEFAVVFGQTGVAQGLRAAERMLATITAAGLSDAEQLVTVSAGLVSAESFPGRPQAADLIKAADAALYRAKAEGRNRLVVSESPPDEI